MEAIEVMAGIGRATKVCTKCERLLPATAEFFGAHPKGRYGLQSRCRACHRAILRAHYRTEKGRNAGAAWKEANQDKWRPYQRKWQRENKDKIVAADRDRLEVPGYREKRRAYNTAWVREKRADPEVSARWQARIRRWLERPEVQAHRREYRRKYIRERMERDPDFRCKFLASTGMRRDLKRMRIGDVPRPKWWEKYFGYTLAALREHLASQFSDGMTWENHGTLWEIDHIRPLSSFATPTFECDEFKIAWALANLRPLLKHQNQAKGAKLTI